MRLKMISAMAAALLLAACASDEAANSGGANANGSSGTNNGITQGAVTPGSVEDFVQRARAFNPRRDPRLLRYSLRHNLRQLPEGTWTWKYDRRWLSPERFASVRQSLRDLRDGADAVTCPVLVVRGAESDAFSDADAADFAATLPNARWTRVEDAGHTVQGDNPGGLVEVLTDFFTQIDHTS